MSIRKLLLIILIPFLITVGILAIIDFHLLKGLIFVLPLFLILFILAIFATRYGKKLTLKYEEGFRKTLSILPLEYLYVRKRLYALGVFAGYQLCFKYGMITANDWAPPIPGIFGGMAVECRFKIPATENIVLHFSMFPDNRSPELRSILGWQNPEPGCYVAKRASQDEQEALHQFQRLSEETKAALRALTSVFGGSCGVAPDWETVMVGKGEALRLAGNNPAVLAQLDFQVKIPFMTSAENLHSYLQSASRAVALLSRDLSKKSDIVRP